jgi:hypothetical protein
MDLVMLMAWTALAAAAALLVRSRIGRPRVGWRVVAVCLCTIAVDKAIDLQNLSLALAKWAVRRMAGGGLGEQRGAVRDTLLVSATLVALAAAAWFARVARRRDEPGLIPAIAGLGLIAVLVGLRLVPAFAVLREERIGWGFEFAAVALVAIGLRQGFLQAKRTST